jgi:hypothetical protein
MMVGTEAAVGLVSDGHLGTMEKIDGTADRYRETDPSELETAMLMIGSRFATTGMTVARGLVAAAAVDRPYAPTIETEIATATVTAAVIGIGIFVTAGMIGTQVEIDPTGIAAASVNNLGIQRRAETETKEKRGTGTETTVVAAVTTHALAHDLATDRGHDHGLNHTAGEAIGINRPLVANRHVPGDNRGLRVSSISTATCLLPATAVGHHVVASDLRRGSEKIGHGLLRSIGIFLGAGAGTGIASASAKAVAPATTIVMETEIETGIERGRRIRMGGEIVTLTETGTRT